MVLTFHSINYTEIINLPYYLFCAHPVTHGGVHDSECDSGG